MERSVEELRLESERNRAALAATVDALKERIADTADDVRKKVSPQHIKSEVSGYISQTTQGWLGALKQQAIDNPMQAVAAGTAIAVPVLRLARGFPLPLLMIGAGLALGSKTVRGRVADAAAPAMETAGEMLDRATERAQEIRGNLMQTASSTRNQANELIGDARDRTDGLVNDLRTGAAQATDRMTDRLGDGIVAARERLERARVSAMDRVGAARDTAAAAPMKARQMVGDNAALIGGIGIAIGAIVAAALPKTEIESKAMKDAHSSAKQAAMKAAQGGFEAAKQTAMSAADAAAQRVAEADLGAHGARMTHNLADTLKAAAEDVVTAAFDPTKHQNT